jgi:hypothetical protein
MPLTIQSNNHWRNFAYRDEVPAKILESEFDYQDPEDTIDGFFRYRGSWYHLDGFMRDGAPDGWHGFAADTFFSGVAIRLSDDGEQYQVATVFAGD